MSDIQSAERAVIDAAMAWNDAFDRIGKTLPSDAANAEREACRHLRALRAEAKNTEKGDAGKDRAGQRSETADATASWPGSARTDSGVPASPPVSEHARGEDLGRAQIEQICREMRDFDYQLARDSILELDKRLSALEGARPIVPYDDSKIVIGGDDAVSGGPMANPARISQAPAAQPAPAAWSEEQRSKAFDLACAASSVLRADDPSQGYTEAGVAKEQDKFCAAIARVAHLFAVPTDIGVCLWCEATLLHKGAHEHLSVCPQHPMRSLEARIRTLEGINADQKRHIDAETWKAYAAEPERDAPSAADVRNAADVETIAEVIHEGWRAKYGDASLHMNAAQPWAEVSENAKAKYRASAEAVVAALRGDGAREKADEWENDPLVQKYDDAQKRIAALEKKLAEAEARFQVEQDLIRKALIYTAPHKNLRGEQIDFEQAAERVRVLYGLDTPAPPAASREELAKAMIRKWNDWDINFPVPESELGEWIDMADLALAHFAMRAPASDGTTKCVVGNHVVESGLPYTTICLAHALAPARSGDRAELVEVLRKWFLREYQSAAIADCNSIATDVLSWLSQRAPQGCDVEALACDLFRAFEPGHSMSPDEKAKAHHLWPDYKAEAKRLAEKPALIRQHCHDAGAATSGDVQALIESDMNLNSHTINAPGLDPNVRRLNLEAALGIVKRRMEAARLSGDKPEAKP